MLPLLGVALCSASPQRRFRRRCPLAARSAQPQPAEGDRVTQAADFEPIAEYRELKRDFISSWGSLSDDEFLVRMVGVFAVGFLPALGLLVVIYPPSDEDGELLVNNIAATGLLASGIALILVLGVLLLIGLQWDKVNKVLQKRAFAVEGPRGDAYKQVKGEPGMRRDKLVADYETEPALRRVRLYLVATSVAAATAWAGGSLVGPEMRMAPEREEEDEDAKLQQEDWRTYVSGGANFSYAAQQKRRGFVGD